MTPIQDGAAQAPPAAPAPPAAQAPPAAPATALDAFVRSAPWPERIGLRALIAVGRRPRGAALVARLPLADQLARATLALGRYDEASCARALGWDADAIVARGRALRRAEGRPA